MFIFREEYYLARTEPRADTAKHAEWQEDMEKVHNLADINIAKQRHGPIGNVPMQFESRFTRFSDLVRHDHLPEETSF